MKKRILVTGGAGFIGTHLVRRLAADGALVCIVDAFDDFYDPAVKHANANETLKLHPGIQLEEGDIRDARFLAKVFGDFGPDVVIHLAARPGVRASIENPLLYCDINITGTQQVLERCRIDGVKKFIFGSSSSVYGASEKIPFSETDPCDRPVSPYAATKRAGELLCAACSRIFEIDITCLRFFSVYGPLQRPEMAVHKFAQLIQSSEPLPMFGDGKSSRDYTFIDDIVEGVVAAIPGINGYKIYNLGNSETVELSELIRIISRAMKKEPQITQLPEQPGDVPATYADISMAEKDLGYRPGTSITDGVEKFVEWFRNR